MNLHILKGNLTVKDNKRVWTWINSTDNFSEKIRVENEPQEGDLIKLADEDYYVSAVQSEIISHHYNLPKGDKFCAVIRKLEYNKGDYVQDVKNNHTYLTQTCY